MKKEMSKVYDPKTVENRIYENWQKKGYFKPEVNPEGDPYTIVMPPPNITGQLHMGHAFDDAIQDALIRYKRMQGYAALWVPGMDHASIATEVKVVDNILETEGKTKDEIGRDEFLVRAWAWADKYRDRIRNQVQKLGASCDWDRERFTMDEDCNHAVIETFVRMYEDDLIYKGSRIINWCPDCKTALSDTEVEYSEQQGHLWHIRYPIKGEDGYVVVATTRPETMLGDTGVAVNPDDERYTQLVGKTVILPLLNREIPIVADDYVDTAFGTGVVKMTPAHDPNDYEVGKRHNLEEINIMNEDGTLNALAGEAYAGMDRYDARKKVVEDLKALDLLEKIEDHAHNVGCCYRCGTTIETMTSEQWFVKMKPLAEPAMEVVKKGETRFVPERYEKIYFNWMENIRDWCISRQLWWGHRIPAYYCDDCGTMIVARKMPEDCPKCGGHHFHQDEDVLDTWFSSGLWPHSTLGWPENTADLKKYYPNNVLVTAYDIIFFWVARMIFMGIYNMGETPYADVYIHGLIRDSQGRKMSKSLGNGIDPLEIIEDYSADALRFSIITGNAAGNDIRWQAEKLESSRNFLNKIWNAARFVLMYMDEDMTSREKAALSNLEEADRWILSKMNDLTREVTTNMDKFELGIAAAKVYDFAWNEYCDWYIELVKPRLYGDIEGSKLAAQYTLSVVLGNILKLLHPVIPFITEEIYSYLPGSDRAIMISQWPEYDGALNYPEAVDHIEFLMAAIKSIRNIRAEMNVPNAKKTSLYFISDNPERQGLIERSAQTFEKLAAITDITMISKTDVKENYVTAVVEDVEFFLSMDELVDKEKEIARLQGEKAKLAKEISRIDSKLNNPGFTAKAPAKIVDAEREKRGKYQETLDAVDERLKFYQQ